MDLAEAARFLCPVCVGPVVKFHIYLVDNAPRAVLCAYCFKAIEKCERAAIERGVDPLFELREHRRFDKHRVKTRGRIARYIALHTEGSFLFPVEAIGELVEDQRSSAHRESGDDAEEERVP